MHALIHNQILDAKSVLKFSSRISSFPSDTQVIEWTLKSGSRTGIFDRESNSVTLPSLKGKRVKRFCVNRQ